jgi:hypothetical protein
MFIVDLSGNKLPVSIVGAVNNDFKSITGKNFLFNWRSESKNNVYCLKIIGYNEILGLISLHYFDDEERVEIKLLEVSIQIPAPTNICKG